MIQLASLERERIKLKLIYGDLCQKIERITQCMEKAQSKKYPDYIIQDYESSLKEAIRAKIRFLAFGNNANLIKDR